MIGVIPVVFLQLASIEHFMRQQQKINAADQKRKAVFAKQEKDGEEEEEEEGVTNSWAITASVPVNESVCGITFPSSVL